VHPKRKVILSVEQIDEKALSVATAPVLVNGFDRFASPFHPPFHLVMFSGPLFMAI
jgi:hypothetical protein